jgi:hypothetical protein
MDFYNDLYVKPEISTFNFKPYEPSPLKLGCTECGKLSGHYSSCSWSTSIFIKPMEPIIPLKPLSSFNSFEKSNDYLLASDFPKLNKVKTWINVDNPVVGTCRNCNHRGLVNDPCIGLY